MGAMERARRNMTLVLGTITALLGVAVIVTTLARGGGPTAVGILLGAALTLVGGARVYFAAESRSHDA
jgi:hypothetical protein